ncbi:MAG: hypothetical protein J5742_04570 [Alphaproteobacteria bacterium]|nr:hypothetical protein [Alphaproteobacteria bacterium]
MYSTKLFFGVVFVAGGLLACPVIAAPTVKNLEGATSTSAYGNVRGTKGIQAESTTAGKRASSVRALSLATKPAATKTVNGTYVGTTKTANAVDSARTPGKHNNLIKGISSKLSSSNSSQPGGSGNTSDLERRITDLEAEMATKQDILESGNGIDINGNTISLSEEIAVLPEIIDELTQNIDELGEQIDAVTLPENYYTIDETEAYLQQHYYTKQYVDQIVNQLSKTNIASHFDPAFLHQGQSAQP